MESLFNKLGIVTILFFFGLFSHWFISNHSVQSWLVLNFSMAVSRWIVESYKNNKK